VKLWDARTPSQIGTFKQPERVYAMSTVEDMLVIGTAGRHVQIYDLRYMDEVLQRRESSLKYQTRCIKCYPDGRGIVLLST
jgi:cell cycle arrest protein BUB3